MKKYLFVGLVLCASFALFMIQSHHASTKTSSVKLQAAIKSSHRSIGILDGEVASTTPAERPTGKGAKIRHPSSKDEIKREIISPLGSFKREAIDFFTGSYLLVEGAYASLDPLPGVTPITKVAGFFVYPERTVNNAQIVFDPARKQYGVFTGEIIVNGAYGKALELIEKSGLEITYQNPQIGHLIFKVSDLQDLSSLTQLRAIPGLSISPDVKFSRLKSM